MNKDRLFPSDCAVEARAQHWLLHASSAIGALIDFRLAVQRWQAAGRVDEREFAGEVRRLDQAGLLVWLNELTAGKEKKNGPAA